MHKSPSALLALGVLVVACTPITEELPVRPNPVFSVPPIVVVPVPIPTPAAPAPAPAPPSNPNPIPTSGPAPPNNPPPPPAPPGPGGGDVPDNTNPVAKLTAKLYFVECNGQIVESPECRVNCRMHLDVTPTDSNNKHTRARGSLEWSYSNPSLFTLGGSQYNPALLIRAPGHIDASARVDGVTSNTVSMDCH